jgi:hypothetical protein
MVSRTDFTSRRVHAVTSPYHFFKFLLCSFLGEVPVPEYGSERVNMAVCFFKLRIECKQNLRTFFLVLRSISHGSWIAACCIGLVLPRVFSPFSSLGGSKRVFNLCGFLPRLLFFHFFPCTALILWRYAFLCSANRSSVLRNSVLFLLRSLTASLFRRKRISSHPSPPRLTTWKQSRMAIAFGNASLAMARMQSERSIVTLPTISRLSAGSCMSTRNTSAGLVPLTTATIAPLRPWASLLWTIVYSSP